MNYKKQFYWYFSFIVTIFILMLGSCRGLKQAYIKIPSMTPSINVDPTKVEDIRLKKGSKSNVLVRFYNPRQLDEKPEETLVANTIERKLFLKSNIKNRNFINEVLTTGGAGLNDVMIMLQPDILVKLTLQEDVIKVNKCELIKNDKKKKYKEKRLANTYSFATATIQAQIIDNATSSIMGNFTYYFIPCSEGSGKKFYVKKESGGYVLMQDKKTPYTTRQPVIKLYDVVEDGMPEFEKYTTEMMNKLFPK